MKVILVAMTLVMTLIAAANAQPTFSGQIYQYKIQPNFKTLNIVSFPQDCWGSGSLALQSSGGYYQQDETRTVNGISFVIHTTRLSYNNQVCLTTDLTDLQAKIPAIINAASVPTNNCASYVRPNPVVEISDTALTMTGNTQAMSFTMSGRMTPWACAPGPPVTHSARDTFGRFHIPYLRVWTTPGPDIKTRGIPANYSESMSFTLGGTGDIVVAVRSSGASLPVFTPQVPQIDMTALVTTALNSAHPTFSHPQAPLVHITGQRYFNNQSQIWGTF